MHRTATRIPLTLVAATLLAPCANADNGYSISTLTHFTAANAMPGGFLTRDPAGNFYGTSYAGGTNNAGTVFKIDAATHALTTLADFAGNQPGCRPFGLAIDSQGNLFGALTYGGLYGKGSLFKLSAANHYALTTLIDFNGANGMWPGTPVIGPDDSVYLGTGSGGSSNRGLLLKLGPAANYTPTTLVTFDGTNGNGAVPVLDTHGNLFATTALSSTSFSLLSINPSTNAVTPVVTITNGASGNLNSAVSFGPNGDLFFTGWSSSNRAAIYHAGPSNNYAVSTLAIFSSVADAFPTRLAVDPSGNIFATSQYGYPAGVGMIPFGNVFELAVANNYAITHLVDFNGTNGASPITNLLLDAQGNLFGQTSGGGASGNGTLFQLTPTPEPAPLALLLPVLLLLRRR